MRIFSGIIGIIIGILVLKYAFKIWNFFGKDADLERIFGSGMGGTFFFIQLVGLAIVLLSLFYMMGWFNFRLV